MAEPLTPNQRLVVTIAVLASFIAFLDGTVVNVALPAISDELGGGLTTQQWVVDSYLITLSALILVAGSVSDAYGRIFVMRIGLIGFGVASLVIAVAPDALVLIIARAVQGAAGAFLVPSSLALITSSMRGPLQARAIGMWTAWTTSAMVIGPLLGGLFVDLLSWRYVFVVNIVPIALTLWLLTRLTTRDAPRPDRHVDWLAATLCTLGLGLAVFALIEEPELGWTHPTIWASAIAGVAMFTAFLLRQRTVRAPILPLEMFRIRNFGTGNIATLFIYAALSLNGFAVVVYLQQGAGLPATLAGLASLPATLIMIALSSSVGTLAGKWGPRPFMTVGPLVMGAGSLLMLAVNDEFNYWWQVLPGMIVFGLGLVITVAPLTAAILGAVDSDRSGIASAVNNAIARVAGLLVIAVLAFITGGALDLNGFHRAVIVTSALVAVGGLVSWAGIRNRMPEADAPAPSEAA